MSISLKRLLLEDPDSVSDRGTEYDWEDNRVLSFFSIVDSHHLGRRFVIVCNKPTLSILTDDHEVEKLYAEQNSGDLKWHRLSFEHLYLASPLNSAGLIEDYERDSVELPVSGRIWAAKLYSQGGEMFREKYICSFWQSSDTVRQYQIQLKNVFVLLKIDIKDCRFEFINKTDELFSYEESFDPNAKPIKSNISKEQMRALLKIQHLTPQAKKALLTKYPQNKLQLAAQKLGISLAQLNHILTGPEIEKFEENLDLDDFLNNDHLNFSDYFDPDVPNEQKPAYSLTPME